MAWYRYGLNPLYIVETLQISSLNETPGQVTKQSLNPLYIVETLQI